MAHGVRAARGVEHGACRDAGPLRVKTPRLPAQGETPFPFPTTASVYTRRRMLSNDGRDCFTVYVNRTGILYTLNLHSERCQLILDKTEKNIKLACAYTRVCL